MRRILRIVLIIFLSGACTALAQVQEKAATDPASVPKVEVLNAYAALELAEKKFNFGEILEGEKITHVFSVKNKGLGPLEIKKVQLGCPCMTSEQDASVPPGGEGKITLKVDSSGQSGAFVRYLTVFTNDPIQPYVRIPIEGKIKPVIEVVPGDLISLKGMVETLVEQSVDLKANEKPFHITGSQTDLEGKISYQVETVEDGRHYRLKVKNTAAEGSYRGGISLQTDLPTKNKIAFQVVGDINGLISVLPQTVTIGQKSAKGKPRIAKIQLRGNVDRAFNIIKTSYDENLMTVTQEAMSNGQGYELQVSPKIENIPAVASKRDAQQTTVSIFTDLRPEPYVIKVNLINVASR